MALRKCIMDVFDVVLYGFFFFFYDRISVSHPDKKDCDECQFLNGNVEY